MEIKILHPLAVLESCTGLPTRWQQYIILYCYIKDCKSITLEAFSPVRLHERINYFKMCVTWPTPAPKLQYELFPGHIHLPIPLNNGWTCFQTQQRPSLPCTNKALKTAISALMQSNEAFDITKSNSNTHTNTTVHTYKHGKSTMTSTEVWHQFENMNLVEFVIALGKEIEVICLLFETRGRETDQPDILMFKFDSHKAAGGWRNEKSSRRKRTLL